MCQVADLPVLSDAEATISCLAPELSEEAEDLIVCSFQRGEVPRDARGEPASPTAARGRPVSAQDRGPFCGVRVRGLSG